jgi:starch synthase
MRVLFVASEGLPFSKTGGIADVVEALPKALSAQGQEVAVVLPRYRNNPANEAKQVMVTQTVSGKKLFPKVMEGSPVNGVRYFFVDEPAFFDRPLLYADNRGDYLDNAERFAEFSRVAVELMKRVWPPDVVHCHDWQTALVPVLLRTQYATDPYVRSLPVVFTIHNLAYQGVFPRNTLVNIDLPTELFTPEYLEFYGQINFLKGGLVFADYLTTVSKRYAKEIQTKEYGCGLEGVIAERSDHLVGILNGVDYSTWNPETDKMIAKNYSHHSLDGKQVCKKALLDAFHLPEENLSRPLIGIVSRFADQKGFDLIANDADSFMREDLALTVLGSGQPQYEDLFLRLARQHPDRVAVRIGYDNELAHAIQAGADMFLMPSRYEPCGLNQIYSLRYGTVPVVRATGGLDDTVHNFDPHTWEGTGFKFADYSGAALLECLRNALRIYQDPKAWRKVQLNGMANDYSWKTSAGEYMKVYAAARTRRGHS